MSTSIRRAALESWLLKASEVVEEQLSYPRRWEEGSVTETLAGILGGTGPARPDDDAAGPGEAA